MKQSSFWANILEDQITKEITLALRNDGKELTMNQQEAYVLLESFLDNPEFQKVAINNLINKNLVRLNHDL